MKGKGRKTGWRMMLAAIVATTLLSMPVGAGADPVARYWIGGETGNWNVDTNWDSDNGSGVPQAGDEARIVPDGSASVTLDKDYDGDNRLLSVKISGGLGGVGSATLFHSGDRVLTIGDGGTLELGTWGGEGRYELGSGTLSVSNETYIGGSGSGYFTQTGGAFQMNGALYIGGSYGEYNMSGGTLTATDHITLGGGASDQGYFNLTGTGQVTADYMHVGRGGFGVFTQNGLGTSNTANWMVIGSESGSVGTYNLHAGTHTLTGDLILGDAAGSTGAYNLYGGTLTVGGVTRIGNYGRGDFYQEGGVFNANEVWIGVGAYQNDGLGSINGYGSYQLVSGELNTTYLIIGGKDWVAQPGVGVFTQDGGTVTAGGLWVGDTVGSKGTYNLNGGDLIVKSWNVIGMRGEGTFNQYGGSHRAVAILELGGFPTAKGTYNLYEGDLVSMGTIVGSWGTGEFNQSGGRHTVNGDLILGNQPGVMGTYSLTDGILATSSTFVGNFGTGVFNQTGGRHYVGVNPDLTVQDGLHELIVGRFGGSTGTYNLGETGELYSARSIVGDAGSTGAFDQSGGSIHVVTNDMIIGQDTGTTGTYKLRDSATLSVGGNLYLGDMGGTGVFNQSGGTNTVTGNLVIGAMSEGGDPWLESKGTYTLTNGDVNVGGWVIVGNTQNARGYFNQSGGNLNLTGGSADLYLGRESGSYGEYTMTDGNLNVGWFYVGWFGEGVFNQSGGTVTLTKDNGEMNVGTEAGSVGTYNLSGGTLDASQVTLFVGNLAGSTGTFNQSGGTLLTRTTIVGNEGVGAFNHSNGTHIVGMEESPGELIVGKSGSGAYVLGQLPFTVTGMKGPVGAFSGPELTVYGTTVVGDSGTGAFVQFEGIHSVKRWITGYDEFGTPSYAGGDLVLGARPTGTGTYAMVGGTLTVEGALTVGGEGTGVFRQDGGDVLVYDFLGVGSSSTGIGTYTLNGGTLSMLGSEVKIGGQGTGTFTQTGGAFTFAGAMYVGDYGIGTYTMQGGTLQGGGIALGEWGGQGRFYHSGGEVTVNSLQLARQNQPSKSLGYYELSGNGVLNAGTVEVGLNGDGHFKQTGGMHNVGELIVKRADLTGTGLYELLGGTLNAGVIENNGTFRVDANASILAYNFFKGTGTVEVLAGVFDNKATMSPGNSPGTLTIVGDFVNTGTMLFELEGYVKGSSYDFLNITGTARLDGFLDVDLLNSFDPAGGSVFNIIHAAGGIDGRFLSWDLPDLTGGRYWDIGYDNDDVFLYVKQQTSVPEPGTLLLLGAGLFGLGAVRRRFSGRN